MNITFSLLRTRAPAGIALLINCLLCSCATTHTPIDSQDHWEQWNRKVLSFNDSVDMLFLKPVAKAYQWTTPKVIDTGVTNFFNNLDDIGVTLNDFLQCKPMQGSLDFSRFVLNSTAGIAGLIDIGQMLDLPKHQEDFDQTLAVWGLPFGSYLVLPFIGPSSTRSILGLLGDALFNPLSYTFLLGGGVVSIASIGSSALEVTDTRAGLLSTEKVINEAAVDRYDFLKSSYLQRRNYLINDGKITDNEKADPLNNDLSQ